MQINLTITDPALERFVEEKVKSGQYEGVDDVVRSALSILREQETLTREHVEELRREVAIGLEQLRRGERADFTAEDISRRGRQILADRAKRQAWGKGPMASVSAITNCVNS